MPDHPHALAADNAHTVIAGMVAVLVASGFTGAQVPYQLDAWVADIRRHIERQPWCTPEHRAGLDHLDAQVRAEFQARRTSRDDENHRRHQLEIRQERDRALLQMRQARERESLETTFTEERTEP